MFTIQKCHIAYTIIGFTYGILMWIHSIIVINYTKKNFNSSNLLGVNIDNYKLPALLISFVITTLYTIKDMTEFNNKAKYTK